MDPKYYLVPLGLIVLMFFLNFLHNRNVRKKRLENGRSKLFEDKEYIIGQIELVGQKIALAKKFPRRLEQINLEILSVEYVNDYFKTLNINSQEELNTAEKFILTIKKELHALASYTKRMEIAKKESLTILKEIKSLIVKLEVMVKKNKISDEKFKSVSREKEFYLDTENTLSEDRDWVDMHQRLARFKKELERTQHSIEEEERNLQNNKFASKRLQEKIHIELSEFDRNIRDKNVSQSNIAAVRKRIDELLFNAKSKYDVGSYLDALNIYKEIENNEFFQLKSLLIEAGCYAQEV